MRLLVRFLPLHSLSRKALRFRLRNLWEDATLENGLARKGRGHRLDGTIWKQNGSVVLHCNLDKAGDLSGFLEAGLPAVFIEIAISRTEHNKLYSTKKRKRPTHFPQLEQKNREMVFPLNVFESLYSFNLSSPVIWTFSLSIIRFAPYAEPAVLRQLAQWQRWPPSRVEFGIGNLDGYGAAETGSFHCLSPLVRS